MANSLETKVSILETKVDNIEKKIDVIDAISIALTKLTVLQEENARQNVERDLERKEQSKLLTSLSETSRQTAETLKELNAKIEATDEKVYNLSNQYKSDCSKNANKIEITKARLGLYTTVIVTLAGLAGTILTILFK